jgi:hypothetical protein
LSLNLGHLVVRYACIVKIRIGVFDLDYHCHQVWPNLMLNAQPLQKPSDKPFQIFIGFVTAHWHNLAIVPSTTCIILKHHAPDMVPISGPVPFTKTTRTDAASLRLALGAASHPGSRPWSKSLIAVI